MTRPFCGLFFTAVAQSVGAGCCPAGTSSNQMRHMPAGGRLSAGIAAGFPLSPRACALTACSGASAAAPRNAKVIASCFISPPWAPTSGAHSHSSTANATETEISRARKALHIIHLTFRRVPMFRTTVRDAGIRCHTSRTDASNLDQRGYTLAAQSTIEKRAEHSRSNLTLFARSAKMPFQFPFSSFSTSPGCACRCSLDFSNTGTPSRSTSKRPPREGMSFTSSFGSALRISAARLAARGS